MLPPSLLLGQLHINNKPSLSIRAVSLSPFGLLFRLSPSDALCIREGIASADLSVWSPQERTWREFSLTSFSLAPEEDEEDPSPDHALYRLEADDPAFRQAIRVLMEHFRTYSDYKKSGEEAALTEWMTDFPASEENRFAKSWPEQRRTLFAGAAPGEDWTRAANSIPHTALCLYTPGDARAFIRNGARAFLEDLLAQYDLSNHPLARRHPDIVYIGSPFCPELFPDDELLKQIISAAAAQDLQPVGVLSFMTEHRREEMLRRIESLRALGVRELVINDWGLVSLLRDKKDTDLSLTLGPLLRPVRRDPRIRLLQKEMPPDRLSAEDVAFLRENFRISRISVEAGGGSEIPAPCCLHLPFYRMNTSARCTLRAACVSGDRGFQTLPDGCPGFCGENFFLYPEAMKTVGAGNSLFGCDMSLLASGEALIRFRNTERLVLQFV